VFGSFSSVSILWNQRRQINTQTSHRVCDLATLLDNSHLSLKAFYPLPLPFTSTSITSTSPNLPPPPQSTINMAYDASELHRILSTLKETKLTLTFKLNLLRSATASSPTHLATFDNLVDRLVDAGSEVWNLEEGIKEREASLFIEDDEEVRSALKKAMALVGTMDSLVEEVMRLKIVLEGVQSGGAVGGQSKVKDTTVAASEGAVTGDVQKATKAPAPLLMGRWPLPVVASAQISLDQRSVSQVRESLFQSFQRLWLTKL
jgi:hypothetical protein